MIDYGLGVKLGCLDVISPDTLRGWRNDYEVYRYCRQNDLLPKKAHLDWYDDELHGTSHNKMYAIVANYEQQVFIGCPPIMVDRPVGVCGLTGLDLVNRRAEFSLYIAPTFQKNGYGKNGLRTLISHGFNTWGLESIWGESFDFNPARKMFTDIGFREEGCRRHFYYRDGRFIDAFIYSILRTEWVNGDGFQRVQKCST